MCQGPGRPGDCSPGLPQIRTCPIKASGSSRHGFTSRLAIGERYVYPRSRCRVLGGCPAHKSMTNISLPSPGSPRSRFPCFTGTMKMCDSLPASRRASLCFAWRYHALRLSLRSRSPERTTASLGLVSGIPLPESARGKDQGVPSSWGILVCLCRVLRPRPDRTPLAMAVYRCCPRAVKNEGSCG